MSVLARCLPLAFLAAGALATASAGASPSPQSDQVSAQAFSIKIVVPDQEGGGTPPVSAPPDAVALGGSFAYPADGSVARTGSLSASASTDVAVDSADAQAASDIESLQLFGGEISAAKLDMRATAGADSNSASGSTEGSVISDLTILGQTVVPTANARIPLADWGSVTLLEQAVDRSAPAGWIGARTTVTGLDLQLTEPHGGLPAGSRILVGSAAASTEVKAQASPRQAPPPSRPTSTVPKSHPPRRAAPKVPRKPPEPRPSPFGSKPIQPVPHRVQPKLKGGGYVFPVFGTVSFTDTFGVPRPDVGWHHGDDIFAPLGAPVLAVAKGIVFSVGWNRLGGNRLWLADKQGNQFYYAHLSAYSPLAVNGGRVNAGDVIGFVGNTGDAAGTPYHLHFEVHPVSLLGKGYDGAVDPTPYLIAWQHLRDLAFSAGISPQSLRRGWPGAGANSAPEPGAILLQVADISTVTGLDPAAIKRALAAGADLASGEGEAAILGLAKQR